MHKKVPMAINL